MPVHYDQAEYDLRCEWGLAGVQALAQISDVLIVVDVTVPPKRSRSRKGRCWPRPGPPAATRSSLHRCNRSRRALLWCCLRRTAALSAHTRVPRQLSLPAYETAARSRPMHARAVRVSPSCQPENSGATARFAYRRDRRGSGPCQSAGPAIARGGNGYCRIRALPAQSARCAGPQYVGQRAGGEGICV